MIPSPLPLWRDLCAGFLHVLYPSLCVGCDADLPSPGQCFCLLCQRRLQPAGMQDLAENEFTDRFWGRLHLESGAAMFYFSRRNPIQRALHQLKYKNQPDIGVRLGRQFGAQLARSPLFAPVEVVLPVPLHPTRERLRGYNQSARIAEGVAASLQVPVLHQALIRRQLSDSQTRKKRMDRFENVQSAFVVKQPERIRHKHLLIIDDVLTTGATLEACGQALLEVPGVRLSMATLAIAVR